MNISTVENASAQHLGPWRSNSSSTTSPELQAVKVAVLITINLIALTGNVLVCLSVYKKPSLRSKTGYLILALAITDLTGALFVTPLTTGSLLVSRNGNPRWITNDWNGPLCFFQGSLMYGITSVSLTIMALAAITRYLCVVRPHLYRKYVSVKLVGISVMMIWIVSLGLQAAIVAPGYATFRFVSTFSACMMSFGEGRFIPLGKIIEKVFLVLWIGFPLSVIVSCYAAIYYTVRRHNRRIATTLQEHITMSCVNLQTKTANLELLVTRECQNDEQRSANEAGSSQSKDSWDSQHQSSLRHEEKEMQDKKEEEKMEKNHFRTIGRRNGIIVTNNHQEIQKSPNVHEKRRHLHQDDWRDNDFECQGLEQTRHKGREDLTVAQECDNQRREHMRPNQQKGRENITVDRDCDNQLREHTRPNQQKGRENITVDRDCDNQRREHTRPNQKKGRETLLRCQLDKNTTARLKQNRAEAKVTRTVLAVFLGFLVCWIPIVMAAAIRQSLRNASSYWDLAVIYFGALSTAINPFIYAATIRDFRRTYVSLFKCNKT